MSLSFRPRFSSPYRGLLTETLHYQIKLENNTLEVVFGLRYIRWGIVVILRAYYKNTDSGYCNTFEK